MSETPETQGASLSERLLEAARRNNTELLLQIRAEVNDEPKLAGLLNSTTELISSNLPLHLATQLGNWEFIDIVLDIEGVEIDPLNRNGDTPLHLAAKYAADEQEHGNFVVDNLLDAGSDPRIKDKHGLKPVNYVNKDNETLRQLLESAEYAISMEIPEEEQLADDGSASDSD